eukprot:2285043-Prymnesium_polylepis.1
MRAALTGSARHPTHEAATLEREPEARHAQRIRSNFTGHVAHRQQQQRTPHHTGSRGVRSTVRTRCQTYILPVVHAASPPEWRERVL